ncbi:uncharacterized protein LY89DRAFT_692307 [Mollisia scopiformis]|uniref:Uncharacterized protein n=1 Tax=Mollisia scopiformis TaxID=149040 RepID=A0A132B4T9_MOLSC|nr:uncharacterized protein LY89DRAFT_692307 [Mollisia scopiformis]KUJ06687.1 hypothetical protein LY89DRAFT_692307 [Mollisia scopiformis]
MIDLFKEQGEALLPSSELYEGSHRPKTKRSLCTPKLLTLWTIINLVSSLALISTFALQQPPTINSLLKKTSYYCTYIISTLKS